MIDCKVKICGLRREEDICCVNAYLPDYIGFVFYPKSKRYVLLKEFHSSGTVPDSHRIPF